MNLVLIRIYIVLITYHMAYYKQHSSTEFNQLYIYIVDIDQIDTKKIGPIKKRLYNYLYNIRLTSATDSPIFLSIRSPIRSS